MKNTLGRTPAVSVLRNQPRTLASAVSYVFAGLALLLGPASPTATAGETTSSASLTTGTTTAKTAAEKPMKVFIAQVDDLLVNPVTSNFLVNAIQRAEREEGILIVRLDTPGGLLQSTREIVKAQLAARVPVITYVSPDGSRAGSAGVFITLASHIAAMAPGTHIGAASPVTVDGKGRTASKRTMNSRRQAEEAKKAAQETSATLAREGATSGPATAGSIEATSTTAAKNTGGVDNDKDGDLDATDDAMTNKVMNDTLAWIESIARIRGRNTEWAREAVGTARSSTAAEALDLKVIDLIADDTADLLRQLDGRTVKVAGGKEIVLRTAGALPESLELSTREGFLNILANPNLAYILLLIGLAGIFYEAVSPGGFIPGILGVICLLFAAMGLQMLPTNLTAILLIIVGLALVIAEVKFTSFGLLALGGIVCLLFGSLTLIERPLPGFTGLSTPLVFTVSGTTALLLGSLAAMVARAHTRRPVTGEESYIGSLAEVMTPLAPEGKVFFDGSLWNAVCTTPIPKGARVRIVAIDGLRLLVEPLDLPPPSPSSIPGPKP